jgi:hypothetical protein
MTLDQALDTLFAAGPDAFMGERDRLTKELKASGDKDAAAAVKAQHKPTQVAAALNRLVREQRSLVEQLLEVGRAMAGGKGDFRAEVEKQRALMQELTARAAALADGDAHALTQVVQGAMASSELATQLLAGRFSKLPEVPVGFFGAPPPAAAAAPAPKAEPKDGKPDTREKERAEHAAALAAARAAADEAEREADEKGREAERLDAAARHAHEAAMKAKHAHAEAVKRAKHLAEQAKKLTHR